MNHKNTFLLQIFEKIGAPLFTSVNEVAMRAVMTGQEENLLTNTQQAEIVAKLLTHITKTSSAVSDKFDLEVNDPDSDDLQIALTAILSPVISNLYQLTGQPPKEEDIEKLVTSFEAINTFSDHFSSLKEGAQRLENLSVKTAPAQDKTQIILQNIMSAVPLVNAVSAFSFGETPEKLLKKTLTRIHENVEVIQKELSEEQGSYAIILNTVIMIYSQCHFSEMARIMALEDKERDDSAVSIESVWTMFDQRMDMLKTLVTSIIGPVDDGLNTPEESKEETPIQTQSGDTPVDTPEEGQNTEKADAPKSDNPMSFFAKKKSDAGEGA